MKENINFITEKEITEEDGNNLVIFRSMHPKGYAYCELQLYFSKKNEKPLNAWIWSLNVDENKRGHGIGSAILEYLENIARENKFKSVHLYMNNEKKGLFRNFYKPKGYRIMKNENEESQYELVKKL